jgi:endoglucanase Acf2
MPSNQTKYMDLLRTHANVISLGSMLSFTYTTDSDSGDLYDTYIDWQPLVIGSKGSSAYGYFSTEVLTFSLSNHREMLMPTVDSPNTMLAYGCQPGLYGPACPVIGNRWMLRDKLASVDFLTKNGMNEHLKEAIYDALDSDLVFNLPWNYQKGAGDTYFSGKMLAKLARIILIADKLGGVDASLIEAAKMNLKRSAEIWLNGSAISPMLYDVTWKGLINCGCDYDGDDNGCFNTFPNCPGLNNVGINFGNGFYNVSSNYLPCIMLFDSRSTTKSSFL